MVNDFNQVPALSPTAGLWYPQVTKKQNLKKYLGNK